jgi:hypothetical protein
MQKLDTAYKAICCMGFTSMLLIKPFFCCPGPTFHFGIKTDPSVKRLKSLSYIVALFHSSIFVLSEVTFCKEFQQVDFRKPNGPQL